MNSPEESAVRDLDHFTSNVLNGMLDMHKTAADLIRYSFTVRSIKDVVRRGSENPELVNQIADSLNHMVIYLNEEIVVYARKANEVGMESRYFTELLKRMSLLYEISVAMGLRKEFHDHELTKHVEASKEAVKITYETCRDFPRWKELTVPLQEFFLDRKEEDAESSVDDVEPTLFAREDGVVTSLAHEQAQSDEDGKKKQFVAKTEKVLNNYRAKNPDYKTMRELINFKTPFRLEDSYADHLINDFVVVWDSAIEHQTDNPSDKYLFTALLKKVFMLMNDKRRNDLATKLFDKYREDGNDVLPCLENFIENFQSGLTESLNKLPLDSNVLNNQPDAFEEIKDQLQWYLFVSPVTTLQQFLMMCVDNKGYVPLITRICRSLHTLFGRSVQITPLPYENDKKDKLLMTMLYRVFTIGRTTWTTSTQWENASFMAMSFAKSRKRNGVISEAPEDQSLLDSFSLVKFALTGLLQENRKPQKAVEIFTQMLQRLLANNNNARMLSNFKFATSVDGSSEDKIVPTPSLMKLMFQLLVEYDGKSKIVSDCAREILRSVGGRMNNDGAVFDAETSSYLTEDSFNSAAWWVKYSIFTWFGPALNNPKRQVPSGIYQVLTDDQKDDFEQIKSDEVATVAECYLKSLFELGLYDVDLAIDLLHIGHNVKFGGSDVVEMMALALVDSYGKRLSKRGGGTEIEKLIKEMLKTIDPIRELVPMKTYNTSYLESARKIEHILVLFMAARIAREKKISAARIRTTESRQASPDELSSLDDVADQLMDVYCETAKTHIEQEASELAKLRETARSLIFNTPGVSSEQINIMVEKEEREQSLVLQLTMLYLKSSQFTRLYQDVPIKLKQLMNVTLDKQFDSQKLLANRVMDDVLTEQRKSEVVYVFAEPPHEEPKEPEKELVEPISVAELVPPKQLQNVYHGDTESTSAENVMFSFNGGENRHENSHQYSHHNTRKNYPNHPEHDRSAPSRGGKNDRFTPNTAYRSRRWNAVNDTQTLAPKHREVMHRNVKFPTHGEYETTSRDDPRRSYEQDSLYHVDRRTPFQSNDARRSDDVRRYSEGRDSGQDNSWENAPSRRWTSESEHSHDDSENRVFDKTYRSVQRFSQRDGFSARASCSDSPSSQSIQEGKPKKGLGGDHNRYHGQPRKPADRKPREFIPNFDHQEEGKKVLKPGHPEREEIVHAFGYSDRATGQKPRRGGHHFQ